MKSTKVWEKILTVGLVGIAAVYALALIKIVLLKSGMTSGLRTIQYVPFSFIKDLTNPELGMDVVLKNILGNFAIFVPLGILLPLSFNKLSFLKTALLGLFVSIFFETLQYIVGFGMSDVDDLILNTLGCMAGAALYFGLFNRSNKRLRAEIISFVFLAVFGCCGVLSLWMYHPSALPAQIVYENESIFSGTDRHSYDLSGVCTGIEDENIKLKEGLVNVSSGSSASKDSNQFKLSENAMIILEYKSFEYSPNGNIQRTKVSYKVADAETADKEIKDIKGAFADLWLDDNNNCIMLIYTVFEQKK